MAINVMWTACMLGRWPVSALWSNSHGMRDCSRYRSFRFSLRSADFALAGPLEDWPRHADGTRSVDGETLKLTFGLSDTAHTP